MNYVVNDGNTTFFQSDVMAGGVITAVWGSAFPLHTGSTWDDGPVNATEAAEWKKTYGKPVKTAEITDGLSNTLLMSEVKQGQGTIFVASHSGAAAQGLSLTSDPTAPKRMSCSGRIATMPTFVMLRASQPV